LGGAQQQTIEVTPILRPYGNKGEEIETKIREMETPWETTARLTKRVFAPRVLGFLQSNGIDMGGEIEQDGKIVWVPSLIDAKVAKEAKQ